MDEKNAIECEYVDVVRVTSKERDAQIARMGRMYLCRGRDQQG